MYLFIYACVRVYVSAYLYIDLWQKFFVRTQHENRLLYVSV